MTGETETHKIDNTGVVGVVGGIIAKSWKSDDSPLIKAKSLETITKCNHA